MEAATGIALKLDAIDTGEEIDLLFDGKEITNQLFVAGPMVEAMGLK